MSAEVHPEWKNESPWDVEHSDPTLRTVLVVDDDLAVRQLLAAILRSAGYRVALAVDGAEAIEMIRRHPPNFVITDWEMPVVNGIELCRMLRAEALRNYVYIVLLTARSQTKDLVEGLAAGADDFCSKPILPGELLARLQAGTRILQLERQLRELARVDYLTGLLNRRTFMEIVDTEWNRALRYGHPLSCAMIDVDLFKQVNDTFGHLAGDAVLARVAQILAHNCRTGDYVGRYGGEEFCALLFGSNEDGAAQWAERCRASIAAEIFAPTGARASVTISVGVAQQRDNERCARILDRADQGLLAAKRAGRNRVVAFSELERAEAPHASRLESDGVATLRTLGSAGEEAGMAGAGGDADAVEIV